MLAVTETDADQITETKSQVLENAGIKKEIPKNMPRTIGTEISNEWIKFDEKDWIWNSKPPKIEVKGSFVA